MAELRNYDPTWRDRIAQALMGDNPSWPRERLVSGLFGSTGLGTQKPGLLDLTPFGNVLGAQEAIQHRDPQGFGLAIMPMPAARGAGALAKEAPHAAPEAMKVLSGEVLPPIKSSKSHDPHDEFSQLMTNLENLSKPSQVVNEGIKEPEKSTNQSLRELDSLITQAYPELPKPESSAWNYTDPFGHVQYSNHLFNNIPSQVPFGVPEKAKAAGYVVPAVHGTRRGEAFEEFKLPEEVTGLPELGIHAGSPKAAQKFTGEYYNPNYPTPRHYPVVLKAQNSLDLPDLGSWGAHRVARGLLDNHPDKFTAEELSKIVPWYQTTPAQYGNVTLEQQRQAMQSLRDLIKSKGYDSVRYKNEVEDPGHISHIVLDPTQIRAPWAKFENLNSRNLLAGLGGAAAVAPEVQGMVNALQKPKEQQQ